jgi:hypothetical protein
MKLCHIKAPIMPCVKYTLSYTKFTQKLKNICFNKHFTNLNDIKIILIFLVRVNLFDN